MLNTEYISNEESRFKPNYIEYMEAEEIENRDSRSERSRFSQLVDPTNSAPQDFPSARANSPNSGSSYLEKKRKRSVRKDKNGKEKKRKDEIEIENRDSRSERTRSSQVVETSNSAPQDYPIPSHTSFLAVLKWRFKM
jgi:hypothetical protein